MTDKKQKIFAIVVFVLVILFGVGQFFSGNLNTSTTQNTSSTPSSANTGPTTQVIAYAPLVQVSSTPVVTGMCFAGSIAAPYRSDAWRCTVGNAIQDPCFELPDSANLICGMDPASTDQSSTIVLQLTKPLPKPEVSTTTIPSNWAWLVELADGTICTPFTGTYPFAATGEIAKYSCSGGQQGEDLYFGDLTSSSSTWTAEVGALSTATSTFPPTIAVSSTVPIFAVWQ